MKIKKEHMAHMDREIKKVLDSDSALLSDYSTGNFPRSELVKDLQRRFCFDLFHMARLSHWAMDNIYTYANDDHLYTALKSICPKVERRY